MKVKIYSLFVLIILIGMVSIIQGQNIILKGAGATFPYPLYQTWINYYAQKFQVRVSYEAIGSTGGYQALSKQEVDFCGSDAFLTENEMNTSISPLLHIPTCLGAVVIFYNLPGNPTFLYPLSILLLYTVPMAVVPPLFLPVTLPP